MEIKLSNAWNSILGVFYRNPSSWDTVKVISEKVDGAWRTIYSSGYTFTANVVADVDRYNVAAKAITDGWDGSSALTANIILNANVYSSVQATPAFVIPALPSGSNVQITIASGKGIFGKGGNAGNGGSSSTAPGNGTDGGDALYTRQAVHINNLGQIAAGGGGGSGGAYNRVTTTELVCVPDGEGGQLCDYQSVTRNHGGGGGGGGQGYTGGQGSGGSGGSGTSGYTGSSGTAGTNSAAGSGGAGGGDAGDGGAGGTHGQNGTRGQSTDDQSSGTAGVGGYAIDGNSFITWNTVGTLLGRTQ